MTVDRTFLTEAEPLVFEERANPAAARKIKPIWYKRLARLIADIGGLEDSVAALPDSQATLYHGDSDELETFAGLGNTLDVDATIPRQWVRNTGAFTIRAPTVDGSCVLLVVNLSGAGAVSFNGFITAAAYRGDTITTTPSDWFLLRIDRIGGFSLVKITQETT